MIMIGMKYKEGSKKSIFESLLVYTEAYNWILADYISFQCFTTVKW